nr:hypothetical protein [Tanacetum cinerariifolium]
MPLKPDLSYTGLDEFASKPVDENDKAKSSIEESKAGNPQIDLQDKGVIDSGCSRHITGNMSYITDYEEIDKRYVAFGGNPKGGKITGKCTIKTARNGQIIPGFLTIPNMLSKKCLKDYLYRNNDPDVVNMVTNRFVEKQVAIADGCEIVVMSETLIF